MTTQQLYKTADGSIWEPSTTEFSGAMAFKLISSHEGVRTGNTCSLNEVIHDYGPIGFYDPEHERRAAVVDALHAVGWPVDIATREVQKFLTEMGNRGYQVLQEGNEC